MADAESSHIEMQHDTSGHAVHSDDAHAGEGHGHPEIPNFITLVKASPLGHSRVVEFLHHWENPVFSILALLVLGCVFKTAMSRAQLIPGKFQNFIEVCIEGLCNFFSEIIGEKYAKRYVLYVSGLFIFILINNYMGLIPFFKAPTSVYNTTLALTICTFLVVHYTGLRENGPIGYVHHIMGSPRDLIGWLLVPVMFPLHLIGEVAKPVSLSLRLFGNVMGEDILLAVFLGLGIAATVGLFGFPDWAPGFPLHFPFFFLGFLMSTIQALVFSLLSCIYIVLVLPHEDEHH